MLIVFIIVRILIIFNVFFYYLHEQHAEKLSWTGRTATFFLSIAIFLLGLNI